MGRLVEQVRHLTSGYARKGGKDNRQQQRQRMIAFAVHAESLGACDLGQVGGRHVVTYWRQRRHLEPMTLYSHHRAIVTLWQLAGKPGLPPRPRDD